MFNLCMHVFCTRCISLIHDNIYIRYYNIDNDSFSLYNTLIYTLHNGYLCVHLANKHIFYIFFHIQVLTVDKAYMVAQVPSALYNVTPWSSKSSRTKTKI